MYAPESSHYTHSENDMIYRCLSQRSREISNLNIKKDADSSEKQQNFSASNPNIFETVIHSITNNTIS